MIELALAASVAVIALAAWDVARRHITARREMSGHVSEQALKAVNTLSDRVDALERRVNKEVMRR